MSLRATGIRGLLMLVLLASIAGAQVEDTLAAKRPLFTPSDALLAGGFLAAAAATAPADQWITRELQDEARQANHLFNRGATIFRLFGQPGALLAGGGIYAIGLVADNNRAQDVGLHSMESIFLGSVITASVKVVAGRARPRVNTQDARNFGLFRGLRDDNYRSFPSGHTTAAFAFASIVTIETSRWSSDSRWIVGPLMYGAATLTGVSRIYNNAHWASDVITGAAIGTLTGVKVFRFQHSHPGNWLDKKFLRAGVSVSNKRVVMPILSVVSK
ncbi:MAG: phosphatase PAP2 family protein [Gemmatimonadaceae bacterium]